jgi:hypothetical protein
MKGVNYSNFFKAFGKSYTTYVAKLCVFVSVLVVLFLGSSSSFAQDNCKNCLVLDSPNPQCALFLTGATSAPSFMDIVNPQSSLPFLPDVCTVGDTSGNVTPTSKPNALNIKFLGLAVIRIYKFIVSFAFYGFGLSLMINAVLYQFNLIQGNGDAYGAFRTNVNRSVVGIIIVLLAYLIVQTILWIFNLQGLLQQKIT